MNKKTTLADVGRMFPEATICEHDDGYFSLPVDFHTLDGLHVVMPKELPIGVDDEVLLPGEFQAIQTAETHRVFRTEQMIQVATGHFEPGKDGKAPRFYLDDPLGARQLLVAVPWGREDEPPTWAAPGMDSSFAKQHAALYLERVAPLYYGATNPILQEVPGADDQRTGMDFWVLGDTGFYCDVCETRSHDLRQRILMGQEQSSERTCRQILQNLADEIANDTKLEGWELVCTDSQAELKLVDRSGRVRTMTVFYRPSFVRGIRDYIALGQAGTLSLTP